MCACGGGRQRSMISSSVTGERKLWAGRLEG